MVGFIRNLWKRTAKTIEVPTEDRQQLEGLETWLVQWMARSGYHKDRVDLCSVKPVAQAFTNESDALKFEQALRDAFAMVQDTITPHSITVVKM